MLNSFIVFSQKQLQITYENHTYNFTNVISSKIKVVGTQNSCLSITEDVWGGEKVVINKSTGGYSFEDNHEIKSYSFFKDFEKNELYYLELNPNMHVKEKLNGFHWKLVDSTRTILGYNCRKATTHYRGRDYVAWFTTELPFKVAPWKFHGLPGVIMEVKSIDDFTHIYATELKIKDGDEPKNPFSKHEFIDWEEFVELYKSKISRMAQRREANNTRANIADSKFVFCMPRIEVILECNRLNSHFKNLWDKKKSLSIEGEKNNFESEKTESEG
ncbi:MAG: GLPGLI family protein [Marinifilum sp.]|jgi:GLPGLI family protein|nr:GLPGLI family protein [Marinifilum sp.]